MQMKLIYPRWPKLEHQTEFHLPPHGPIVFAATLPDWIDVTFFDENRVELDLDDQPDVVAISSMLTVQIPRAKEIAAAYRARGIPVIAGGISVMLHAEEMAQAVDAVFLGEAEGRIDGMMEDLRRGELKKVYDFMGDLPPTELVGTARRDLLNRDLYTYRGVKMVDLVHASRGCRFSCAPCSTSYLGGRRFRPRPMDKVVEEIKSIDNERLFIVDNSLAQDSDWERDLFRALEPLGKKWVSHPLESDPELMKMAYDAGCWYVYQAIIAPSDGIKRRIDMYKEAGIGVEGTMILGTDDQTEDDIIKLIDFTIEMDMDMAEFTVATPFPHTLYRTLMGRDGRILHDDWIRYNAGQVVIKPKHMTPERLQELYHYAWDRFYGGAGGREIKMARLFSKVVKREREERRQKARGERTWD